MRVFAFPGSSEAPFGGDVSSEALAASDEEVCWGTGERGEQHRAQGGRDDPEGGGGHRDGPHGDLRLLDFCDVDARRADMGPGEFCHHGAIFSSECAACAALG